MRPISQGHGAELIPLVVIAGPTGSGKSSLALKIAESFGGEIVNYDSVQVYRGMDVGSAKTPVAERHGIRHHLIDCIQPTDELTAGGYSALARECIGEIANRQVVPVLVGGTGFYLRSLLDGLSPAPARNPKLRQRLQEVWLRRPGALHRFLRRGDPNAAGRIHANDSQKLIRAIEIAVEQPDRFTLPREPLTGFQVIKIGLNPERTDLYSRLNERCVRMFDEGLLEETRLLIGRGVPAEGKALQSLGYKQAVAVIQERLSRAQAILELQVKTRQYAKRQLTWFRREAGMEWLEGFGQDVGIEQAALRMVEDKIALHWRY